MDGYIVSADRAALRAGNITLKKKYNPGFMFNKWLFI